MKVLCKDRHYRRFWIYQTTKHPTWNKVIKAQCQHCNKYIHIPKRLWDKEDIKLKKHTCKARLKELQK